MAVIKAVMHFLLRTVPLVILLLAAIAVLLFTGISLFQSTTAAPKDWLEYVSLIIVGIGGLLSFFASSITRDAQTKSATDLTNLQGTLNTQLETVRSALAADLEGVKTELAGRLSNTEKRIDEYVSREYLAYDTLWRASSGYFQALNLLQRGEVKEQTFENLALTLAECESSALYVASDDLALFYDFRREATYISGEARILKRDGGPPEAVRNLWTTERAGVAELYNKLRERFQEKLSPPTSVQQGREKP
jgi:hypothetical protein